MTISKTPNPAKGLGGQKSVPTAITLDLKNVPHQTPKVPLKSVVRTGASPSLKNLDYSAMMPRITPGVVMEFAVDCYSSYWTNYLQNGQYFMVFSSVI